MNRFICRNLLSAVPRQPNSIGILKACSRPVFLRQYASASSHPATDAPTAEELANNRDYYFDKAGKRRVSVEFEYPGKFYVLLLYIYVLTLFHRSFKGATD